MSNLEQNKSKRRPRRFFSRDKLVAPGQRVALSPEESAHLRNTLRLEAGAACLVTDGAGSVGEAVVLGFDRRHCALVKIDKLRKSADDLSGPAGISVYAALPQKGYFDDWVRKSQELCLARICPLETRRTVVKMKGPARKRVLQRWQRIVREAAKQSGAASLVEVLEPRSLESALALAGEGRKIVFHPDPDAKPFRGWLMDLLDGPAEKLKVHAFFGPEGGFDAGEVALLKQAGAEVVSLGPAILRMDTAVIGVMAAFRFLFP